MSWQSTMIKGNECFDSHNWLEAERYYNRAIELVDLLWQQKISNLEAMQAWVCGYQNLAATYEQQGQLERALQCLLHAHYRVLQQANNKAVSEHAQSHALQMSSVTFKSISTFKGKHANYTRCMDVLDHVCAAPADIKNAKLKAALVH